MADFLFGPVPHDEAVDFIASKPVVSRQVFDRLLPELRARAFTVTGVDAATTVQAIRDRIADLPAGATWDAVKKDVARQVSPHFIDPDADADERDKQVNASNRRAELLLRTHGFQAYQQTACARQEEQKDVLPYYQYLTMGDGRVRHTHAALDGIVLPATSPFWHDHTGPWEWGCRCQRVQLSREDRDEIKAQDANKPADQQRVLEDSLARELESNNRLVRGPNQIFNVTRPTGPGAFSWRPGDHGMTVEDLRARYDATTFGDFETWARRTDVEKGKSVWEWIGGQKNPAPPSGSGGTLAVVPSKTPATAGPSAPAPKLPPPATVAELLNRVGLDLATDAQPTQMEALRTALIKDAPVSATAVLKSVQGASGYTHITDAHLRSLAQGFVNMLPPSVVTNRLPAFDLVVRPALADALGTYDQTLMRLELDGGTLDADLAALHKTMWHEMIHWAHDHGPSDFRARVAALFAARTHGFADPVVPLRPWNRATITGYEDDWLDANGDEYSGRVYPWETAAPRGLEIVTRHLEKLALSPVEMARHWNHQSVKTGHYAWRAAFVECLHLFFPPPSAIP